MRADKREIFRDAVFLWMMPFEAERMISGCASRSATLAASLSPEAIASSTLRTYDLTRLRRALLMRVRRSAWRAAFFADFVFAISQIPFAAGRPAFQAYSGMERCPHAHRQQPSMHIPAIGLTVNVRQAAERAAVEIFNALDLKSHALNAIGLRRAVHFEERVARKCEPACDPAVFKMLQLCA